MSRLDADKFHLAFLTAPTTTVREITRGEARKVQGENTFLGADAYPPEFADVCEGEIGAVLEAGNTIRYVVV